jgi:hypothetical protein
LLPREIKLSCILPRELQTENCYLPREMTLIQILYHILQRTLNGILNTPSALFMDLLLPLLMVIQKNSTRKFISTWIQFSLSATTLLLGTSVMIFGNLFLDCFIKPTRASLLPMELAHAYKTERFGFT